jgi:prepilin-type N-terminal cleavage/methylation domain-containing protein
MNSRQKQSGFTLIEIAIVLVIVGLLIGGVLKGQELITQAKIKSVVGDFTGTQTALYGYQDRYKQLPGNDPGAATRWTGATAGSGSGSILGKYNDPSNTAIGTSETPYFWQDLRLAGFIAGDSTSTAAPKNSFGGAVGVQMSTGVLGFPNPTVMICSGSLPGKVAEAVDAQLDDGKPNSGTVRAMADTAPPTTLTNTPAAGYVDDGNTLYVVCQRL